MNRREILKSFLVVPAATALTPKEAKSVENFGKSIAEHPETVRLQAETNAACLRRVNDLRGATAGAMFSAIAMRYDK